MGRKEELQAKEDRTEEEQRELDALLEAENEDKKTDEEEFNEAFDEAMDDSPPKEDEKVDDEDGKDKQDSDEGTGDEPEEDEDKDEHGLIKPPDEDDKGDTDDSGSEPDEGSVEWWKIENAKLTQKMKSWEGRITKANNRAEEAERKLEEALKGKSTLDKDDETSPEGDDQDDDAADAIKEFTTEYPSLEKPIKAIATKMAESIVETKIKDLQPQLDELTTRAETADEAVLEDHFAVIRAAHPDFESIRDSGKLQAWLDKQDSFVKYGFERVIAEGTAEEIIDMFDHYKGVKASQSSSNKHREKAKAKAKKHLAVDGESGGPIDRKAGKAAKDDFDGAWDEALST